MCHKAHITAYVCAQLHWHKSRERKNSINNGFCPYSAAARAPTHIIDTDRNHILVICAKAELFSQILPVHHHISRWQKQHTPTHCERGRDRLLFTLLDSRAQPLPFAAPRTSYTYSMWRRADVPVFGCKTGVGPDWYMKTTNRWYTVSK